MSLIIKNVSSNKWKEKKQLYTWGACIFVVLFILSIAMPMLSGGKKESGSKYKDSYYDLANMPFSTDAAEDALMASANYDDIGKSDLLNALFSKKDKEERQAEDEELGTPAPPDEDYKQAEQAKAASAARAARPAAAVRSSAGRLITPTQVGRLSSGGRLNMGSGGGGVSSSLPTQTKNSNNSKAVNNQTLTKSMEQLNKSGRASGFVDTYAKTKAAVGDKDLSGKAGKAADAFQNGNAEGGDGALEAAAAELGIDPSTMRPTNAEGLGDLQRKLENKRDSSKDSEHCKTMFSGWDCFFTELGTQTLNAGMEIGKGWLKNKVGVDDNINSAHQKMIDRCYGSDQSKCTGKYKAQYDAYQESLKYQNSNNNNNSSNK